MISQDYKVRVELGVNVKSQEDLEKIQSILKTEVR